MSSSLMEVKRRRRPAQEAAIYDDESRMGGESWLMAEDLHKWTGRRGGTAAGIPTARGTGSTNTTFLSEALKRRSLVALSVQHPLVAR